MFYNDLAATASAVDRPVLLTGTVLHMESCITMLFGPSWVDSLGHLDPVSPVIVKEVCCLIKLGDPYLELLLPTSVKENWKLAIDDA